MFLPFPGLEGVSVPATHAIALSGGRLVASFFHSSDAAAVPGASALHFGRNDALQLANSAGCQEVPNALPGAADLAAIMQLQAPLQMTLQRIFDLFQACDVLLAGEVIPHLPEYVASALSQAPPFEVRAHVYICLAYIIYLL